MIVTLREAIAQQLAQHTATTNIYPIDYKYADNIIALIAKAVDHTPTELREIEIVT